jgi:hypothetical protein
VGIDLFAATPPALSGELVSRVTVAVWVPPAANITEGLEKVQVIS